MTDKFYINWEKFHQDVKSACEKIKKLGKFDKIVAISRGGLVPAGIISYQLTIRNCHCLNVATYFGQEHRLLDKLDLKENVGDINESTLIIDDLTETGQTFRLLRQEFPKACYVSIYTKEQGKAEIDVFAREVPNQWIVFPWDID